MATVLGFSLHSGWVVCVAVEGPAPDVAVLDRWRLEVVDRDLPRQAYHAAAGLEADAASRLVERVTEAALVAATRQLGAVQADLIARGRPPAAVALVAEPRSIPQDVQHVLASHPLMHAAEGELYREAVAAAADQLGLPVTHVPPKRLDSIVASTLGLDEQEVASMLVAVGRGLGPPWQADHKRATLAALVSLAGG